MSSALVRLSQMRYGFSVLLFSTFSNCSGGGVSHRPLGTGGTIDAYTSLVVTLHIVFVM